MFDFIETYDCDLELYRELGLTPFKNVPCNKDYYIGKYNDEYGEVKIWVNGCPSQFYSFEIHSKEANTTYQCSTGSGSLTTYWPTVKLLLRDMFVVNHASQPIVKQIKAKAEGK